MEIRYLSWNDTQMPQFEGNIENRFKMCLSKWKLLFRHPSCKIIQIKCIFIYNKIIIYFITKKRHGNGKEIREVIYAISYILYVFYDHVLTILFL